MPEAPAPPPMLPSLASADWLKQPATRAVLEALSCAGFEGRIVGGTVRNALMGLPVTDIDIATPAPPEAVVEASARAGLKAVPTGLEHGTVTVIAEHRGFEVTTLRRDVETDGRRATVAFTDDWAEDAARRDFTMNALYCDADGRLHDPVGGYPDVVARRVRFIGDADTRIREDYLRVLRYFRFYAAYAAGEPDAVALAACARGIQGMARLSAERVRAELVKLLVAPRAREAVAAMTDIGLLSYLLGAAPRPGIFARVLAAEAAYGAEPDAMLRLSALAISGPDDVARLADRLRLSNAERKTLQVLDLSTTDSLPALDDAAARRIVYRKGPEASRRFALGLAVIDDARRPEAELLLSVARSWSVPKLPFSGADVVAAGIPPGPAVGEVLAEIEAWWVEADFPDAATVAANARQAIAARRGAKT
ncbi:MAG: CCA tRNA nucleotidyltransferase [Proteobacteria bacterium]|nr:CCA tRNA nucleotidyltransferase [Pseudomonadota bacterium]